MLHDELFPLLQHKPLKVWVLAPHLVSNDANIDYYYDFSQSIEEYTRIFAEMKIDWQWQPVTISDYPGQVEKIINESDRTGTVPVVLNLCDGDEVNGTPGISVIRLLEEKEMIYTGADEYFYHITTSKVPMKKAFEEHGVSTPGWITIDSPEQELKGVFEKLGHPVIVKPAVSGGSMGVGTRNVVESVEALELQVKNMFNGYRGWNLAADGIIAESFIKGAEYTVLIVGSAMFPKSLVVYPPVERIFHQSLSENEKFLSFDRLWEIYEEETAMPGDADFYQYATPDISLHTAIKQISLDAYIAVGGTGYTRVDIRMDQQTGKLYVLEVNAQCGISEDENYTSIGAILRLSGNTFASMLAAIINDALARKGHLIHKQQLPARKIV